MKVKAEPVRILKGHNKDRIGAIVERFSNGVNCLVWVYDELGHPAGMIVANEHTDLQKLGEDNQAQNAYGLELLAKAMGNSNE